LGVLSVVLIGRNDNHGYNLSKRVSQSINSIAQNLTSTDEIIFVDWNSPLGYPPMPISIHDDLSEFAKKLLKIVVVPPSIHAQFTGQANKMLLEPLARNVGMRRVSNDSKWILNTNTDILLLNPTQLSLRDVAEKYDKSPTVAFRYEIPEFIWESFDRRDPHGIQKTLRKWHELKFLEKNVGITLDQEQELVLPDGVGDFQLATKELWYSVTGYAEDMLKGWHVDTRAAIQMNKLSAGLKFINPEELSIFHQNHMRTSTIYHNSDETNDESLVFESYKNDAAWGLADIHLETIQLDDYQSKVHIGIDLSYEMLDERRIRPAGDSVEMQRNLDYSLKHSSAFLMDEIQLLHENDQILLVSHNESVIKWISKVCMKLNLTLYVCGKFNEEITHFNLLILDLGLESDTPVASANGFLEYETFPNMHAVGQIVLDLDAWSRKARLNKSRVLVIRAQNWATRTRVRNLFSVALFNNYSGILTGQAKSENPEKTLQNFLVGGGISYDYGLKISSWTTRPIRTFNQILSFFSPKTRLRIKKYIKQFLRF
jgi:hypothetical protein